MAVNSISLGGNWSRPSGSTGNRRQVARGKRGRANPSVFTSSSQTRVLFSFGSFERLLTPARYWKYAFGSNFRLSLIAML